MNDNLKGKNCRNEQIAPINCGLTLFSDSECGRRMAVVRNSVLVLAWLLPLTVAASYTCNISSTVVHSLTADFLRTFGKAAGEVRKKTFEQPSRVMNFTLASTDTHRNVTIWSICDANCSKLMCSSCLSILFTNIYDLCCVQGAFWGQMNTRTLCSIAYTAPDYVIPGWIDPGDLPKEVSVLPKPINFDAAHTIFRTYKLYPIYLPLLLFNTFVGMY